MKLKYLNACLCMASVILISLIIMTGCDSSGKQEGTLNKKAANDLIKRVIPDYANRFEVEYIPKAGNKDVFELETVDGKIILRGNNGVSVASALNYWLKNYAYCDVSWNGINLNIPEPFPLVPEKIREESPHKYRHYFNYCTFNYTASWWDWERWQWEIDYMALNGINMPLAMTGQNAVWDRVYKGMGFTQEDMDKFFTGPAYFMWFWAGNIDGWNGPLPQSWMKSHEDLQKKILARERELGMTPVLPAFTGHVPPTFKDKFPDAKLKRTNWEGRFDDTYILEPDDPMFKEIGNKFMEEQIKTFGTDHLYGADTFNEMVPPGNDSLYLNNISRAVYESMATVDSKAVWVMQGWLFVDKKQFWGPSQIQAYLKAVPDSSLIVLDLWAEENPVWNRTEAFYGKPWIWCMLHNFGGRNMIFGNLKKLAYESANVLNDPSSGQITGIGAVPEGIEQNPVVYSLMFEHVWRNTPVDIDSWVKDYAHRRYGERNTHMEKAWEILLNGAYSGEGNYESAITARPTFEKHNNWAYTDIPYDPKDMLNAWTYMLEASSGLKNNDCYQYDLILVGKQVLANYATIIQQEFKKDYETQNKAGFQKHSREFLELIDDTDELMSTRRELLLGKWLNDAKAWGTNENESRLFEKNARDIITLWGGKNAVLHDYASKQWAGLFKGFYKGRWQLFIDEVNNCLDTGREYNHEASDNNVREWEWKWVNRNELYPDKPVGDPVEISEKMHEKYANKISAE